MDPDKSHEVPNYRKFKLIRTSILLGLKCLNIKAVCSTALESVPSFVVVLGVYI